MNTDTLQDIMLQLPYKDVLSMCSVYHLSLQTCTDDFWKKKTAIDYDIIGDRKDYKKLYDIDNLVSNLLSVLKKLVGKKRVIITMELPDHANFYENVSEIYFTIHLYKNTYTYEINYLADALVEASINEKDLKMFLIKLIYNHPNVLITQGIENYPILLKDLLNWETAWFQDYRNQLINLWQEVYLIKHH